MQPADLPHVVGVDIGGANLKFASAEGRAWSIGFSLWKHPETLAATLQTQLIKHAPSGRMDALAVTITGELADCFIDRAEGVEYLVQQAAYVAKQLRVPEIQFYGVDGRFHLEERAIEQADLIAAANWHALAAFVARDVAPDGLLVDVGSTTSDIVPIAGGRVATHARTDHERLLEGSLVYVGCRRTPVCALVDRLTHRGQEVPVMNEIFATIDDAQLLVGGVDEDPSDLDTADGRPRTREAACNRLARMIGLDRRQVNATAAESLARQVVVAARDLIAAAVIKFEHRHPMIVSGHGTGLLEVDSTHTIRLSDVLNPDVARCAPSYAVARIMRDNLIGRAI